MATWAVVWFAGSIGRSFAWALSLLVLAWQLTTSGEFTAVVFTCLEEIEQEISEQPKVISKALRHDESRNERIRN